MATSMPALLCALGEGSEVFRYTENCSDAKRFDGHGVEVHRGNYTMLGEIADWTLLSLSGSSGTSLEDGDLIYHSMATCDQGVVKFNPRTRGQPLNG